MAKKRLQKNILPKHSSAESSVVSNPASTVISSLSISGYRSCVETTIDFQPDLSVLIGPNGGGKTNILNALILLRSLIKGPEDPNVQQATNHSSLKATFRCDQKPCKLTADIRLNTDSNNQDVIVNSKQSWRSQSATGNSTAGNFPLWIMQHGTGDENRWFRYLRSARPSTPYGHINELPEKLHQPVAQVYEFLRDLKYYSASQFTNPTLCPVSFEVEKEGVHRRGIGLHGHTKFLYDLYASRKSADYKDFFNVIGPDGIKLIDDITFTELLTSSVEYTVRSGGEFQPRKQEKLIVVPQFLVGRNKLSPSQLSDGTFKTITLLFYLMTEKSTALLIEEPEVCVHHGLLSSIVELIKSYSRHKQIIVSTHSDFILDRIEPRHLYRVSRTDYGTSVSHVTKVMSAKALTALKAYLETEGNLGEYWRHGGLD